MFPTTRPSVDTLPSRLDSWDRYKGLKREGRKDDLNIDSSLWNPEAIFSDVIRYPKMDIHRTGQAWTLIARFSNSDAKNWMEDSGEWWFDKSVGVGGIADPSVNTNMLLPAFWLVRGREFKITRSDDPLHTALLQTTGDCPGGKTFREKITSYGNFRKGTVWASDDCQGNCAVQYGGQFQATDGFGQATCNGSIQSAAQVGFWCDWGHGDGAVLMIGGGGRDCQRAGHGIGITETSKASFLDREGKGEEDFGNEARHGARITNTYSLNMWVN